eukprot:RCo031266
MRSVQSLRGTVDFSTVAATASSSFTMTTSPDGIVFQGRADKAGSGEVVLRGTWRGGEGREGHFDARLVDEDVALDGEAGSQDEYDDLRYDEDDVEGRSDREEGARSPSPSE